MYPEVNRLAFALVPACCVHCALPGDRLRPPLQAGSTGRPTTTLAWSGETGSPLSTHPPPVPSAPWVQGERQVPYYSLSWPSGPHLRHPCPPQGTASVPCFQTRVSTWWGDTGHPRSPEQVWALLGAPSHLVPRWLCSSGPQLSHCQKEPS